MLMDLKFAFKCAWLGFQSLHMLFWTCSGYFPLFYNSQHCKIHYGVEHLLHLLYFLLKVSFSTWKQLGLSWEIFSKKLQEGNVFPLSHMSVYLFTGKTQVTITHESLGSTGQGPVKGLTIWLIRIRLKCFISFILVFRVKGSTLESTPDVQTADLVLI